MTSSGFTPGPWHFDTLRPDKLSHIHNADDGWVASCFSKDARIVAAAPEMREALRDLLEAVESSGGMESAPNVEAPEMPAARAALARAGGQ